MMDKKLAELQAEVDKLKKQNEVVPKVAFSTWQRGKDSQVFINEGNGYDKTTGYFIAPVKGAYQFTHTSLSDGLSGSSVNSGAMLLKNGQPHVNTWKSEGKDDSDYSITVIWEVEAGDKLWPNPCDAELKHGFPKGSFLGVKGKVDHDAKSFTVKLHCQQGDAFSLKADFLNHRVEFNSHLKDDPVYVPIPFIQGQSFELKIVAESKRFHITVNDAELYDFLYRTELPLDKVEVEGDLVIKSVDLPDPDS